MARDRVISLPNALSLSRILLAAGFMATAERGARVALIGVASATDFLDGFLARRSGTASRWGALLDPIADRFFVLAAVASFMARGELTVGEYFTLLARDLATAVGFLVARVIPWLRRVAFVARPVGKWVTVFQLLALLAVVVLPDAVRPLVVVVGALSLAAIADYTLALWRARAR